MTSNTLGSHSDVPLDESDTTAKRKRLTCFMVDCDAKVSQKCGKCSTIGKPVPLCLPASGRDCWNRFHMQRVHDVPSDNSQE